jgi:hypothetical protein
LFAATVRRICMNCSHDLLNHGEASGQHARSPLRISGYRPVPVIPIIGARKRSQFQDNLASFELTLSADQLKTLDEASVIELGFPYEMYAKAMPRAICYGGLRDQILA